MYAVIEWQDAKPLILAFHRDMNCSRLKQELDDPEIDKLRLVVRNPDRIAAVLAGQVVPSRSEKHLIELRPSSEPGLFLDPDANPHRIAPCPDCVGAHNEAGSIVSRTHMGVPEPFARYKSAPVLLEASVQSAIREGDFRSSPATAFPPGPELLRTYRLRAEHLGRFSTPHAEQLRTDIVAFCAALEALPPECPIECCSLDLNDGRSLVLFERADTHGLLGILRTVDRRMVTDEEWDSLWGVDHAG